MAKEVETVKQHIESQSEPVATTARFHSDAFDKPSDWSRKPSDISTRNSQNSGGDQNLPKMTVTSSADDKSRTSQVLSKDNPHSSQFVSIEPKLPSIEVKPAPTHIAGSANSKFDKTTIINSELTAEDLKLISKIGNLYPGLITKIDPPKELTESDYENLAKQMMESRKLPEEWKHDIQSGKLDVNKLNEAFKKFGSELRVELKNGATNLVDYAVSKTDFDGRIIDSTDPTQIGQSNMDWSSIFAKLGASSSLDPRENEEDREGIQNAQGDGIAFNSKGQIDEFQYHDDNYPVGDEHLQKHSYKIGYNADGQINKILAPNGDEFRRIGNTDNWSRCLPKNVRGIDSPKYNLGNVTVDQSGIHASGADSQKLGLPVR